MQHIWFRSYSAMEKSTTFPASSSQLNTPVQFAFVILGIKVERFQRGKICTLTLNAEVALRLFSRARVSLKSLSCR